MQNTVNQQCIAGSSQCLQNNRYWVQIEAECRYHSFLSVKEGKNVLEAKHNYFHFCVLKSFSVHGRNI